MAVKQNRRKMIIDNVKRICKEHGFNLTQLATKLGVNKNTLYVTLKNPNIKLSTISKIANVLNCALIDIIAPEAVSIAPEAVSIQNKTTSNVDNNNFICPACGAKLCVTHPDD